RRHQAGDERISRSSRTELDQVTSVSSFPPWWRFLLSSSPSSGNPHAPRVRPNIVTVLRQEPTLFDEFGKSLVHAILIVRAGLVELFQRLVGQRHLRAAKLTQPILWGRLPLPHHTVRRDRHVDEHVPHAAFRVAIAVEREQRSVALRIVVDV